MTNKQLVLLVTSLATIAAGVTYSISLEINTGDNQYAGTTVSGSSTNQSFVMIGNGNTFTATCK